VSAKPRLVSLIAVVLTAFVLLPAWTSAQTAATHSYYYFKEPLPLQLDATRIAVFSEQAAEEQGVRRALTAVGIGPDQIQRHTLDHWWVAQTPSAVRGAAQVQGLVQSLKSQAGADFTSPVLLDARGAPVLITRDILLRFGRDVSAEHAEQILATLDVGTVLDRNFAGLPGVYRVRSSAKDGFAVLDAANMLAQMPEVEFAEPDKVIQGKLHLTPNDPYYTNGSLWGLNNTGQSGGTANMDMDAPEAWNITTGSSSIKVATLDLGAQLNHPDLAANLTDGYDATGNGTGGGPYTTCDNHGTMVAGCVAAIMNNGVGVVGIAPGCKVMPIKIGVANTPCSGSFSAMDSWLVNGLNWAVTHGARATSSSFGWGSSSAITTAYTSAYNSGLIHFASSGNDGASSISYPSSLSVVNSVGAVDRNGNRASWSNYGTGLDFSAPGVAIWTTDRTGSAGDSSGDYIQVDGTSFSSPYAAGVAALILSRSSALTPTQVATIMQNTCKDRGAAGYDTVYGWGLVDAYYAVNSMNNPPQPFNLVSPADGATTVSTSPTFTWTVSTYAFTYTLQVATDPNFSSMAAERTGITATSYQLTGDVLAQQTLYYWRIIAVGVGTQTSTPARRSFTTWRDCNHNNQDDAVDLASGTSHDCNSNGIPDECDTASGYSLDCDQNAVPDECEPDCNHNGIPDACDIASGYSLDCNGNGIPDECDLANCDGSPWCGDCNSNGIPDVCDLSSTFQVTSPTYTPLGTPTVHTFTLYAPPDASGSVVLTFSALGDLFATSRYVNVSINNQAVGTAYGHSGYFSCSPNQIDTLSVPTATYNTLKAAGGGNVAIAMTPTTNMNPTACGSTPTTIQVTVAYPASSNAQDVNSNGIPDQCEPGACCFADGHCEMKKAALCTQAGGTYKGLGTTCTPNPCPQPTTGACCLPNGSCTVGTPAACTGTYQGDGTTCTPSPCPQPTGACCFPNGSCTLVTQANCTGTWQGAGTTCTPNPCPQPTGACCFPNGSCALVTQANCAGTWQGAGTTCTPNPCPQPTGACCFPNSSCTVGTPAACTGTYQGDGTTCTPNPCPQPSGACCFPNGSCTLVTQANCTGTWQGADTTCTPNPCPPELCPGDMNCDGRVTFADIDLFVAALSGESAWTHAPCPWLNADCNGDLNVTFADIDPFVAVIGTTCP
jgi:subtilisin family serine protease